MTRVEIPLLGKIVWATGDALLRAEVELLVKTNSQTWEPMIFLVDSGTEMTSISAGEALKLNLPFPQQPVPGLLHQPTGQAVRAGVIRVQIVAMGAAEYEFPCYFVGDPQSPSHHAPTRSRNLLGLTGVVDKLRITFDGDATPGAPYGNLILERK